MIDGVIDERVAVASANARFEATIAKSDMLLDDDSSARAKRTKKKALAEEARLLAACVRLQVAKAELAAYVVAIHGAVPSAIAGSPSVKFDDEDAADKKAQRLMKMKLPSPKDGWKDGKRATIVAFSDKNTLLQQLLNIFWKLRGVLRDQATATLAASNSTERSLGVERANLSDPEDYEDKQEAMSVCEALEFGLNQLHEAGCALYTKCMYNQAVVDIF